MGKSKLPKWLDKAWLNLGDIENIKVSNPLAGRSVLEIENPGLAEVRLMRNPNYLHYAAKTLLNITLLPIQAVILEELWKRPFPMFIASRGFGKCVKDCYVQTNCGFCKIEELFTDDDPFDTQIPFNTPLLGEKGFHTPKYKWKTKKNSYRLETTQGFELIGSEDHPVKIVRKNQIIWEKLSNITISDKVIFDLNHMDKWGGEVNKLTKEEAYFFGCMTTNKDMLKENGKLEIEHDVWSLMTMCRKGAKKIMGKPKHHPKYLDFQWYLPDKISQMKDEYGFDILNKDEITVPKVVLGASKYVISWYLKGFFDCAEIFPKSERSRYVRVLSGSRELLKTIQFLFLKFNVVAKLRGMENGKYKLMFLRDDLKYFRRHLYRYENKNKNVVPWQLIGDKLVKICKKFYKQHILKARNKYKIKLSNSFRIKKTALTFEYVQSVLRIFSMSAECRSMPEFDEILEVLKINYFCDRVYKIENIGEQTLYDVYFDEEDHSFLTNGIISHNSFLMGVYALLRCALVNNTKFVVCGAGFRQSKIIHDYMCTIWNNAPILRSVCSTSSGPKFSIDRCIFIVNNSICSCIPIGDGQKIRGMRATNILCDEFDSINPDIYETVIQGFSSVSSDPINNVMLMSKKREMEKLGLWSEEIAEQYLIKKSNQAVISGTAGYSFRNFYKYFTKYKKMIEANNNLEKLKEIYGEEEIPKSFNSSDYSIIRIPYELIPEGFMDEKTILRAKSTMHSGIYKMEFSTCFAKDSEGFFRRALIESCVGTPENPIRLPSGDVWFDTTLHGDPFKEYIMGIDPAAAPDNFSIVIIELNEDHNRVVYCWTTNRPEFQKRLKNGLANEHDYYGFCARKIRELMGVFTCKYIVMDSQGGGIAVEEALHDKDKLKDGEMPIWRVVDDKHPNNYDNMPGLHILHLCNFANSEWTAMANNGLKKDFEDKALLFPRYDSVTLSLAAEEDSLKQKIMKKVGAGKTEQEGAEEHSMFDTLEDCVIEIEELKTELSTIILTSTNMGRDRWDTPSVKLPNGKKGKLRKDRYSALVMANMIARQYKRALPSIEYQVIGDWSHELVNSVTNIDKGMPLYDGPSWFIDGMKGMYGGG